MKYGKFLAGLALIAATTLSTATVSANGRWGNQDKALAVQQGQNTEKAAAREKRKAEHKANKALRKAEKERLKAERKANKKDDDNVVQASQQQQAQVRVDVGQQDSRPAATTPTTIGQEKTRSRN